jgi:hypothetical protein
MNDHDRSPIDRRPGGIATALCLFAACTAAACNVPPPPETPEDHQASAFGGCAPQDVDCLVNDYINRVSVAATSASVTVNLGDTYASPGYYYFSYFDHSLNALFAIVKAWSSGGDILIGRYICDGSPTQATSCEMYASNEVSGGTQNSFYDVSIVANRLGLPASQTLAASLDGAALRAYRSESLDGLRLAAAAWTDRDVGKACAQHCSDSETTLTSLITGLACAVFGELGGAACHTGREVAGAGRFQGCYEECLGCFDEQSESCPENQYISDKCRINQPWACDEDHKVMFRGILRTQ